tara:strand:- start:241 stop:690 length:450 start_codon:yes stop_codon:yes gene_type:complete
MVLKMKNICIGIGLFFFLLGCGTDEDSLRQYNPYLINPQVNITLNLNLPQYNDLNFPGGSAIITSQGIRGIVVYRLNEDLFTAFELSDPNHIPSDCSRMTINGIEATCPCPNEDNTYNIVTGEHKTMPALYPMLGYRIERDGNTLRITN